MLYVFWLLLIFIPEGLGLFLGRDLSRTFINAFPFISFLNFLFQKAKIKIPIKISLLWIFFLILYFFSSIFSSGDIQVSFKWLFLQTSLFFSFIFFYNTQNLKFRFLEIGILISVIFCVYTSFIYIGINFFSNSLLTLPENGYQYVYSKFGSHNHLGDFLVIFFFAVCFYIQKHKSIFLYFLGLIFIIFIIGSYSRSAYISLALTIAIYSFWKRHEISKLKLNILIGVLILLFSLSFVVVKDVQNLPVIGQLHGFIQSVGKLGDKEITAKRFAFLYQAEQGIKAKPLLGFGPGNFLEVSTLYTPHQTRTHSAHNILLDLGAEVGLPALIIFTSIIGLILWNAIKNPTVISLMIIAFLINSMTDYTYRIYSFLFLFVALSGLNHQEKGVYMNRKQQKVFLALTFISIIFLLILL
jgi:O-antigen ligase